MSILIADSGATKTKWCLFSSEDRKTVRTEGLNPYYHSRESIREILRDDLSGSIDLEKVEKIFFYGAGCDSEEKNEKVYSALRDVFPDADSSVFHDLLGAARAIFLDKPGIACILGTGSNSCLYNGEVIEEHIPSLAFILGDEGSAGYFGKKLINSYYRFEIPDDLRSSLEADYNMDLKHITEGLYESSQMSRFIASYASFLGKHKDHPFVKKMLEEGFENFVDRILMKYSNAQSHKVGFVGSVAHAHQNLITEILKERDMIPGLYVQNPMDRLVKYHSGER